ncbi:MAG: hypothetical protein LBP19_10790 [Treponema sp.]|jgi:hypothetical protein|nr:hypothetical protein [Treponema sp.]
MINRRAYRAESALKPGCAVVQGSGDTTVKAPGASGAGDFIGVYPYEANEAKEAGEPVGIVLHGVVKVLAGGTVAAGKKAVVKSDTSGAFEALPDEAGQYNTVGIFLESGAEGEYVDMLVEHGSVTIPAAE